jgi:uncharacterized protein YxjI
MSPTGFNPPLGPQPANAAFYSPQPTTLQMKEKILSLSGDDFTISTADGTPVCKCKGKVFSLHGTKAFTDLQGNELFTVKKKMLAIQKSFVCDSPQGYSFEVKGHFSLGSSKSSVHFKNAADGQQVELDLKGDWFDRSAKITLNGAVVAEVARKFFNVREMFGDKQTVSLVSFSLVLVSALLTVTLVVLCYGCAKRRPHAHRSHLRLLGRAREREVGTKKPSDQPDCKIPRLGPCCNKPMVPVQ